MKGEKQFLISLEMSICFEAKGPCTTTLPILEEVRLPKPLCNLDADFSLPGICHGIKLKLYTILIYSENIAMLTCHRLLLLTQ